MWAKDNHFSIHYISYHYFFNTENQLIIINNNNHFWTNKFEIKVIINLELKQLIKRKERNNSKSKKLIINSN